MWLDKNIWPRSLRKRRIFGKKMCISRCPLLCESDDESTSVSLIDRPRLDMHYSATITLPRVIIIKKDF